MKKTAVVCSAAIAAAAVAILFYSPAVESVFSQQKRSPRQSSQEKEYVAVRKIIYDRRTKTLRLPDAQELDDLVRDLGRLTDMSTEGLERFPLKGGGEGMDLDGRFGGVMLARARPDGSSEVRCVFSFEEGAAFLGIEEKISDR